MASKSTISIGFKIEAGKDGLHNLIVDAQGLRKALEATVTETKKLNDSVINFAALSTGIDSVSGTLKSLQATVKEYTGAYQAQVQVERQLEQVMRNTMDAREEDIQSIKDFCSAQQQIGVIGDEVQLAGAQELATYLELKSSLKELIPVMNDMLAQQYGYNASQENAAQIATMLGKVMEGQTGALSRYGYKFDEAQEKILKYGTESERVATLVDVVSSSVGGMNRQLAQTPTGPMKQLDNALGDVKEQIGEFALMAEPFVTLAAGIMITTGSLFKLWNGAKVAYQTMAALKIVTVTTDKAMKALGVSSRITATCIKGLLVSTGVGLVIWGLVEAIQYFISTTDDAADSVDRLTSAEERAKRAAEMSQDLIDAEADARKNAVSSLELYKSKLENFNGTKTEERKLVDELNSTYGQTMGYFKSVAEWYQALIKNSKAYCDQMVAEAKARKLADQVAELELKRETILHNADGTAKKYSKKKEYDKEVFDKEYFKRYGIRRMKVIYKDSDLEKAQKAYDDYTAEIDNLKSQMTSAAKTAATISMPMAGSKENPFGASVTPDSGKGKKSTGITKEAAPSGSIADYESRISDIRKKIEYTVDPDEIYKLERERMALQDKTEALEMPVKLASSSKDIAERIGKIEPLKLDVEVDTHGLKEGLKSIPQVLSPAEKFQRQLQGMAGAASSASQAFQGMGQAFEVPALDIMGMLAGAIATMIQGYATATSESTALGPFGWLSFGLTGLAQLTAMVSQVKNLSKFADGGIVSGPTMALVGEYAGASRNPEVIAPLDKLQRMIGNSGGGAQVVIPDVRIKGSDLVIAFGHARSVDRKTGRRPAGL